VLPETALTGYFVEGGVRPGVVYRLVRNAPPVQVRLGWWADRPPPGLDALRALVREEYATVTARP